MGLTEPMLVAIGIAGVIFMFYLFNVMRPLQGAARILATSVIPLLLL